jgi:hypothetical protein
MTKSNNVIFFGYFSVVVRVAQAPQPVTIVVDHQICIMHVIPSALRVVFSWLDQISVLERKSDVEILENFD